MAEGHGNGHISRPLSSSSSEPDPYDPNQDLDGDDPFFGPTSTSNVTEQDAMNVTKDDFGTDGDPDNYLEHALSNLLLKAHGHQGEKNRGLLDDLGALLAVVCHEGNVGYAEKLLMADAPVNHRTSSGAAPLHLCCQAGHADVCKLLLQHKADVDLLMDPGMSSLYIAALNGKLDCVQLLLDAKASLQTSAEDECSPLHAACQEGHNIIVDLLLVAANATSNDVASTSVWLHGPGGRSALVTACENGWTDIVRTLLMSGWPLEGAISSSGYPPLYVAAMNGHRELVELLIQHKADVNEVCCDQSHALLAASQEGHIECVELLVAARADLNLPRDTDGATALYVASESNHLHVVQVLVEASATLDVATTEDGSTPLIVAAQSGHLEVLERLLCAGADANQPRNSVGKRASPMFVAAINGHVAVVRRLLQASANVNVADIDNETPLFVACREGFAEVALLLLEAKAEVDAVVEDSGLQALHAACERGLETVVESLLCAKANLTAETEDGAFPLLLAAESGSAAVVALLLEGQADPNQQVPDEQEYSSVLAAAATSSTASAEAVRKLVEAGARPAPGHRAKQTLVQEARRKGHSTIADFLLQELP
eukprot:GGOE01001348.1.p1 GENE.GGOE01001348.1~~GGOE01001348.1.p1  ORF type:complete len:602 (+),score=149.54 GGOE01001348.1:92-1897(+)